MGKKAFRPARFFCVAKSGGIGQKASSADKKASFSGNLCRN